MSGVCVITGKKTITVNHVSHSKRRVKSKSKSNVSFKNISVEFANINERLKVSAAGIRTIDFKNGLARHLLSVSRNKLNPKLRQLRKKVIYFFLQEDVSKDPILSEVKEKLLQSRSGRKLLPSKCRVIKNPSLNFNLNNQ